MTIVETAAKICARKSSQINLDLIFFSHRLQGLLDRVHFLIFDLKSPSDTGCFISFGTRLQIFVPKWDPVSVLF